MECHPGVPSSWSTLSRVTPAWNTKTLKPLSLFSACRFSAPLMLVSNRNSYYCHFPRCGLVFAPVTHTKARSACRCQLVACLWIGAKNGYDGFREQGAASFDFTLQYQGWCVVSALSLFFFFYNIEKFVAVKRRLSLQWEPPKFGNIVR